MSRKITTEIFIARAKEIHGDKYIYDCSRYIANKFTLKIECREHGIFLQTPASHISGKSGCPKCSGNAKLTNKIFLERAIKIHGNKYSYELIDCKNISDLQKIICKIHGIFEQRPNNHLNMGQGCPKCYDYKRLTLVSFIEKANIIHNNKYIYTNSKYIDYLTDLDIECRIHGIFTTKPKSHLFEHGRFGICPKCDGEARSLQLNNFIERAEIIHNDTYDYSLLNSDNFKGGKFHTPILCKIHGVFLQTPNGHLNGRGCKNCKHFVSKDEVKWLDSLSVPKEWRQKHLYLNNKKCVVDAIDINLNIIYEFYGDYYHGNPNVFEANSLNTRCKPNITFGELYSKTLEREAILKAAGYNIISIWESDWKARQQDVSQEI